MKAKVQTRLAKDRPDLGDRLPLNTPLVLVLDPSSICNLRCGFCPTGDEKLIGQCSNRTQKIMSLDLFQRIMNDTENGFDGKIRVLRLYKEGEPLVNPGFEDMVRYAKKNNQKIGRIDTTTNGLLLNPERNRKLIEAGIDQINISVNGVSAEQYRKYTRKSVDFDRYVSNIKDLYANRGNCEIYIKAIKDNLTEEEQKRFFDIFGECADRIFLERIAEPWPHFKSEFIPEEVTWGNYDQAGDFKTVCPYLFYTMVVNSDGTVSSCIGDWKHEQILGNCAEESVAAIWNGEKCRKMWVDHLRGERGKYPMCSACNVINYGCYDNIDMYADRILEKLKA